MIRPVHRSMFWILLFIFPFRPLAAEETEKISTRSAVIFNTLCAKCHEGECSGRLSFDTGSKSAGSHIRRYTGDTNISRQKIKEFFRLLNYMKKTCTILMPKDQTWKTDKLSHFALPSSKGYFIPLGLLESGRYRIEVAIKEDTPFKAEVISKHFEHLLEQQISPVKKENTLQFTLSKPEHVFLRIQSRTLLYIDSLNIGKAR